MPHNYWTALHCTVQWTAHSTAKCTAQCTIAPAPQGPGAAGARMAWAWAWAWPRGAYRTPPCPPPYKVDTHLAHHVIPCHPVPPCQPMPLFQPMSSYPLSPQTPGLRMVGWTTPPPPGASTTARCHTRHRLFFTTNYVFFPSSFPPLAQVQASGEAAWLQVDLGEDRLVSGIQVRG